MPSDYYTSYIPFITATPKEDFIPVGNTNSQRVGGRKLLPTSRIVLYIAETIKNRSIPFVLVWFCFMLFNLSGAQAQSAEARAAEGQTEIKPLLVGQKVPDEFWKEKHLLYINGDTVRQDISAYKDKVLILGFWATWCSPCLKNGMLIEEAVNGQPERLAYVKINPTRSKDNIAKIERLLDGPIGQRYNLRRSNFSSIVEDTYFQQLFPHHGYPLYVWINKGVIQLMTFRNLFDQRIGRHLFGGEL